MSQQTKKDTARESGNSIKEVSRAWHDARDDAAKEGNWNVPEDRHDKSDSDGRDDNGGGVLSSIWDLVFGK